MGIFSKFIMPFSWSQIHLLERLQGPTGKYFLGTDELGRDELSRLIYGARISMEVGLGATLLSTLVSIIIGATSGFLGGKTDMVVQRFVDVYMSIPYFVILLTLMTILPRSLITILLVLGIGGGIAGARLVRSAVIGIKSNMYVSASEAVGSSPLRTLLVHILPNIMPTLIITFTLGIGGAILAEAGLSFLGFGLPPGVPSWGVLINSSQAYLQTDPQFGVMARSGAFAGSLRYEHVWRQHQGPSRPALERRRRTLRSLREEIERTEKKTWPGKLPQVIIIFFK